MRTNYDCPVCQTNFVYTQEELDELELEKQQTENEFPNTFYRESIDYEIEQITRFYNIDDTPETYRNTKIIDTVMTAYFHKDIPLLRKIAEEYPTTSNEVYDPDLHMAFHNLVTKMENDM
jgi:pyruvate-formate lyase